MRHEARWSLGLIFLLCASEVLANTGVAPLANSLSGVVVWLIPIVIAEALVVRKVLGASAGPLAWVVVAANVASTAAGFVLVWLESIVDGPMLHVGVANGTIGDVLALALLVPFFAISAAVEYPVWVLARRTLDRGLLKRAVILANASSYVLMGAFLIGRIVKSAIVHGKFVVHFPP